MPLPAGQLATGSWTINGTSIPIRSLSRTEAFKIRTLGDDLEAVEVHLIACGTSSTADEVGLFRDSTDPKAVDDLVEAIAKLSGIMPNGQENGTGPKA